MVTKKMIELILKIHYSPASFHTRVVCLVCFEPKLWDKGTFRKHLFVHALCNENAELCFKLHTTDGRKIVNLFEGQKKSVFYDT